MQLLPNRKCPGVRRPRHKQALIKHCQLAVRDRASLPAYGLHTQVCVFFSFNLFIKESCGKVGHECPSCSFLLKWSLHHLCMSPSSVNPAKKRISPHFPGCASSCTWCLNVKQRGAVFNKCHAALFSAVEHCYMKLIVLNRWTNMRH